MLKADMKSHAQYEYCLLVQNESVGNSDQPSAKYKCRLCASSARSETQNQRISITFLGCKNIFRDDMNTHDKTQLIQKYKMTFRGQFL